MSVAATAPPVAVAYAPRLQRSLERFRGALLWLTGFSGALVFMEPSPYEAASLLTIIVFAVTGLTLRPAIIPFILLLIGYSIGFALAVVPLSDQSRLVIWVFVSWYLAVTAIFYAAMLGTNTQERLTLLARGYLAAAILASLAGILAYFHLLGGLSETFLRFDRARGTFNDPNVLGAFLIFPSLLALQKVMNGSSAQVVRGIALLGLFAVAILLSFSRAAWGQFVGTAVFLMALTFMTTGSHRARMRIVLIAIAGVVAMALFIAALLSIDRVAELFVQRASLEQDYDVGHLGRFGRYLLGFQLALERPFGIGPLQFALIFPEDPHNTFLNTFMSGGWLSGCFYLTLALTTLVAGLRFAFVKTPWQPVYLAVYSAFVGTQVESAIIDTDHWRHYFLLLGVLWGLMIASRPYIRQRVMVNAAAPPAAVQPRAARAA